MRALISVSDKTGVVEFARALVDLRFELVSTGGTAAVLRDARLPVTDVAAVTGAPEMLGGRVKTLHPRIAAGVLADRHDPDHVRQLTDAGIEPFDLVCVNLYRFEDAAARGVDDEALIEEIDIGGPDARARGREEPCFGRDRHRPGRLRGRPGRAAGARVRDRRDAPAPGPHRVSADRRLRRGDRRRARRTVGAGRPLPRPPHGPAPAPRAPSLRGEPPPGRRALRPTRRPTHRRSARDGWDAPGRQAALVQQPARRVRGGGDRARPASGTRSSSSSTRTRAGSPRRPTSSRPGSGPWRPTR